MMNKALNNFLISLILLIVIFQVSYHIPLNLPARLSNWLRSIGIILSFIFSFLAVTKGVKKIKSKENSFIYNLIAIIGSTIILIIISFWAVLLISLNFGGFPNQD